jgi:hypothetical protein
VQHWYGYHSEKTMGYAYDTAGGSAMYIKRPPAKLVMNDIVWVVEGDLRNPTRFALVDCFEYTYAEYPPFAPAFTKFGLRVLGTRSLLSGTVPLNRAERWFSELHSRFITKQKFFNSLISEPEIVDGLLRISGIKL